MNSPLINRREELVARKCTKMIVSDIDGTLVKEGGSNSSIRSFKAMIDAREPSTVFAYATGRNIAKTAAVIKQYGLPEADIYITSVGSSIFYDLEGTIHETEFETHIRKGFDREKVAALLTGLDGITLQPSEDQSTVKLSYFIAPHLFNEDELMQRLEPIKKSLSVITSSGLYLDILPAKASKKKAIDFIANLLSLKKKNIATCGDTGNDLDMLSGGYVGIVVKNHSPELDVLRDTAGVKFVDHEAAEGVIEGLSKKGFL